MSQDKALRKSLSSIHHQLPYGFENRLMQRVIRTAEKRARKQYLLSMIHTAAVSTIMLSAALFSLNYYSGFNILNIFASLALKTSHHAWYWVWVYALCLLLLLADFLIRQIMRKKTQ